MGDRRGLHMHAACACVQPLHLHLHALEAQPRFICKSLRACQRPTGRCFPPSLPPSLIPSLIASPHPRPPAVRSTPCPQRSRRCDPSCLQEGEGGGGGGGTGAGAEGGDGEVAHEAAKAGRGGPPRGTPFSTLGDQDASVSARVQVGGCLIGRTTAGQAVQDACRTPPQSPRCWSRPPVHAGWK